MQVVLIGAGRLATQLGLALRRSGHDVTAVYSRTMESAETLAGKIGCRAVNAPLQLPQEADVFILSVKDSAMESLIPQITSGREGQLFVHTAGSVSIELLQGHARRWVVFCNNWLAVAISFCKLAISVCNCSLVFPPLWL